MSISSQVVLLLNPLDLCSWFSMVDSVKKIIRLIAALLVKLLAVCVVFQMFSTSAIAASPKENFSKLTFITEAYPPYNFMDQGILVGIAVDLLQEATKVGAIPFEQDKIKVYPWARGYQQVLKGPDVVLFSTTRTEERENLFKWAGPISSTRIVLLALKEKNIKIKTNQEMQEYVIGGIRDDVGEQLVLAAGYQKNKFISQANANAVLNMLVKKRMDLWAYEEFVAGWFIKKNQLSAKDFESVYLLKEGQLYFAFSKDVDNEVIKILQQGIDKVKTMPGAVGKTIYEDILFRYL